MGNLQSGNLLEVTRWQVLDLNANPTLSLNHQGFKKNIPEYLSVENTRRIGGTGDHLGYSS